MGLAPRQSLVAASGLLGLRLPDRGREGVATCLNGLARRLVRFSLAASLKGVGYMRVKRLLPFVPFLGADPREGTSLSKFSQAQLSRRIFSGFM